MQVKIIIGTISFMLTMMILGFAALREPARLEVYSLAFEGRSIETGAHIFESNCATCHGVEGRAEECYDTSGNQIGCVGLPLNNQLLLCDVEGSRTDVLEWDGTIEAYIQNAIAAGRVGTQMPTWSERFGGPMRDDQIQDVAAFVLNWHTDEMCSAPIVTFDWPDTIDDFLALEEITTPGDVTNGEALYLSYGCIGCHGNMAEGSINNIGPWLGDIATRGGDIIEGYTAEQYIYESILNPNAYIAAECPNGPCTGPPSAMLNTFAGRMAGTPQDMSDLITYIISSSE